MRLAEAGRPAPGSLLWLVLHEVRLTLRSRRTGYGKWIRIILLLAFFAIGVSVAVALRGVPLLPNPSWLVIGNAVLLVVLTFMTTQTLTTTLRTLFEKSDLDLLLSSPLPEGRVLAAKLLGIAASAGATYFLLILPLATPTAMLGHPRLLALVPVLAALAMVAASIGLALAILLVRFVGARGARAVGNIAAAALGGGVYLISQLAGHNSPGHGRIVGIANWLRESGWGVGGWSAMPARGLFGEAVPLLALLAASAALFTLTSWLFRTRFLAGYQKAGERSGRRAAASGRGPVFRGSLLGNVVAKETRLLVREPEILFTVLLRLIYLFPLVLLGFRNGSGMGAIAVPALAAVGVIAAGQLCGSVAWLTISAEDAPDLLAVAPVEPRRLKRMKLVAALVIVAPVAAIVPLVIAARGAPLGAVIAFAGTLMAGAGAGWIELTLGKPAKRNAFVRRRQGSLLTSLLGVFLSLIVAAATAVAVFFV
ncbi:MAG: type transport system permease protein [Sphingomonadales bacterium]|jgi:ABC-2 type transport system permease protein|nr:type transport system permease protein [Sphingomonadales bacterium]